MLSAWMCWPKILRVITGHNMGIGSEILIPWTLSKQAIHRQNISNFILNFLAYSGQRLASLVLSKAHTPQNELGQKSKHDSSHTGTITNSFARQRRCYSTETVWSWCHGPWCSDASAPFFFNLVVIRVGCPHNIKQDGCCSEIGQQSLSSTYFSSECFSCILSYVKNGLVAFIYLTSIARYWKQTISVITFATIVWPSERFALQAFKRLIPCANMCTSNFCEPHWRTAFVFDRIPWDTMGQSWASKKRIAWSRSCNVRICAGQEISMFDPWDPFFFC